jgi:23S rRNA pseudouridine1911/1915/1917 synthase
MHILYEDPSLIFINKAPDIVVQRGHDASEAVLYEQVRDYLAAKHEEAFLLQRLDRGTSGVIFFTKTSAVNRNVTRQFETKTMRKSYLAICEGRLEQQQTIDAPLARVGPISFGVRPHGKRAITAVTPLAWSDRGSLIELGLLTGRTHQIRAHLAAIHHPLAGDWLYGKRNAPRPMLHAESLSLRHPNTGEPLFVRAPVPADFLNELDHRQLRPKENRFETVSE